MGKTLVYKFGKQKDNRLSPKEGIKTHLLHAEANGGKVLLTMDKFPSTKHRDNIDEIIITVKSGEYAAIGKIDDLGRFKVYSPPEGYTKPSIYKDEDEEKMGWFAISGLKETKILRGQYISNNGKDLLDRISANAYMVYIEDEK